MKNAPQFGKGDNDNYCYLGNTLLPLYRSLNSIIYRAIDLKYVRN
jgi:hypothetical protein